MMIRRLLSLAYGVIVFWVGYLLICRSFFHVSASDMILNCSSGVTAFYQAAAAALIPLAATILLFSKFPFIKRAWANAGCAFGSALILLFSAIFLGAGESVTMTLFLANQWLGAACFH